MAKKKTNMTIPTRFAPPGVKLDLCPARHAKFLLVWSSLYSYSQDPEQAVEVEEELALDDRKLPLAYNYPRHQEEICGEETESQVMVWNK